MKQATGVELKRLLRQYKRENRHQRELSILLQSVEYPYNVGAIFRLADGAGIRELILTGITPTPPHPTISKVGRNKDRKVSWRYETKSRDALEGLKRDGCQLVALELAESATPYHRYPFADRTCLVAGHEDHGLTRETLGMCDGVVFVPMFGKGRSHNVGTALAIVVYHILMAPAE